MRSSLLINFLTFTAGAAVGSVVTWKLIKTKYEQIAQEEIDSVKESFSNKPNYEGPEDSDEAERANEPNPTDIREYASKLQSEGYTDYSNVNNSKPEKKTVADNVEKPYVISPEEYGDIEEYDCIELTYYEDGVLTDDGDEIIDDVDAIVGEGSLETFGDYEDDSVHVRNDRLKCDYEILRDPRKYSDVHKPSPHRAEGR